MVVALSSYFGFASLAEAEDLVQDTFAAALDNWRSRGIPRQPENWLYKVCKNKALSYQKKQQIRSSSGFAPAEEASYQLEQAFSANEIEDNELRMIYACCHPHFSAKAQLVLILKTLCGFSTEKAAHHLGMQPEAVRKLHYRTLETIKEKQLSLRSPHLLLLAARTDNVYRILYLLFTEGSFPYQGAELLNIDSALEALRLLRLLLGHPKICTADTHALYALFLFHLARVPARTDAAGQMVELEQQDRSLWQQDLIRLGIRHLNRALAFGQPLSRYQLEALIASLHCRAASFSETDWQKIAQCYEMLLRVNPGPFVAINHAIAVYFERGASVAMPLLERSLYLPQFEQQQLYHAFMGRLCQDRGAPEEAAQHYQKAISLTQHQLEKSLLSKKLLQLLEVHSGKIPVQGISSGKL